MLDETSKDAKPVKRNGSLSNLIGEAIGQSRHKIPGSPSLASKRTQNPPSLPKKDNAAWKTYSSKSTSDGKPMGESSSGLANSTTSLGRMSDVSALTIGTGIGSEAPEERNAPGRSKSLDPDEIFDPMQRASITCAHSSSAMLSMLSDDGSIRTDWEEGVAVIESILLPGSDALNALSESQISGLRRVQRILLGGTLIDMSLHIPKGLLNDPTEPGSTSDFILRQYGGIKRMPAKKRVMNVINAHRFIKQLKTRRSSFRALMAESQEAYVLSEWIRLERNNQIELANLLSWENLQKWDFDIFKVHEYSKNQPLLFVGWAIMCSPYSQWVMRQSLKTEEEAANDPPISPDELPGYNFPRKFKISQEIMVNFLRSTEAEYVSDNPYHNNIHAADVLQTLHCILYGMGAKAFATADLETFSLLVAAIVHDMGHPGENNAFQINSESDLAIEYNDVSVLENMHVSRAFRKLMGNGLDQTVNIFKGFSQEQRNASRKMIIEAVLATDMTKHFTTVNKIKGLCLSQKDLSSLNEDDSWQIMHYCLHIADISNQAKPTEIAVRWTDRCLEEFFLQGDNEKRLGLQVSPLCDRMTTQRGNSQIGFIKFVVQPAFEIMARIIPAFGEIALPLLLTNLQYWKDEDAKSTVVVEEDGAAGKEA